MFAHVVEGLDKSGCAKDALVVLEKPFGRDLDSARQLNSILLSAFPETQSLVMSFPSVHTNKAPGVRKRQII